MADFYHNPEDRNTFTGLLKQNNGIVKGFEAQMQRKDGRVIWVSTSAHYVFDKNGVPVGVEGVSRDITEKKRLEEELKESSEKYKRLFEENRSMLEYAPQGIIKLNEEAEMIYMNASMKKILGVPTGEVPVNLGQSIKVVNSVLKAGFLPLVEKILRGERISVEGPFVSTYGKETYLDIQGIPVQEDGNFSGALIVVTDITEREKAKSALIKEKDKAQKILTSIHDIVIHTDRTGNIIYANPALKEFLELNPSEILNRQFHEVFEIKNESTDQIISDIFAAASAAKDKIFFRDPLRIWNANGEKSYSIEITVTPTKNSSEELSGFVIVIHDMTEIRGLTKKLSFQAAHDALTGLLNRREFDKLVNEALENSRETGNEHALCYMDLNKFKFINDSSGHLAGDEVLKQIAPIVQACIRSSDIFARIGGDEFGFLFYGCSIEKAIKITEKIQQGLTEYRFQWEGRQYEIGASIGIVPITKKTPSLTELFGAADSACYQAKESPENHIHVFSERNSK